MRLRGLRKQKGLTMKELGHLVNVSESAISQYETGKRNADYETMLKFADIFNVSVDYLLGRIDEKTPTENGERVQEKDLKVALFGGGGEVTDEMWEEAQFAIQLIKERHKRKKDGND